MSNNDTAAQREREFDHFSIVPFKAICGADVPNQSTTQSPERSKCAMCWHYWKEFEASRASSVPARSEDAEKPVRYDLKYYENSVGDLTDAALEESATGEYVKYADVAPPIAAELAVPARASIYATSRISPELGAELKEIETRQRKRLETADLWGLGQPPPYVKDIDRLIAIIRKLGGK